MVPGARPNRCICKETFNPHTLRSVCLSVRRPHWVSRSLASPSQHFSPMCAPKGLFNPHSPQTEVHAAQDGLEFSM